MGITQHEHGTQNVQQLVNLLLMKGNIGKPGAGICPLRGHSNVQGDRTVGITRNRLQSFWLAWVSAMASHHLKHLDMLQLPACKQYVQGRLEH
ncbi:putative molybdopterin-binding oxidoreductase [Escherichia coli]|uniref:Putative molybdopterin-binding oxidoreductase n=1 Tax=Escherichia coli TaxID=562 RepID=A0A377BIN0_ECOLX|nr:putative molybdopterin-binding oxidoreductase [Escherichia coli]